MKKILTGNVLIIFSTVCYFIGCCYLKSWLPIYYVSFVLSTIGLIVVYSETRTAVTLPLLGATSFFGSLSCILPSLGVSDGLIISSSILSSICFIACGTRYCWLLYHTEKM